MNTHQEYPSTGWRAATDRVPMTMGVLREIVGAARDGYFVRDVQHEDGSDEYHVAYRQFRSSEDVSVTYSGDGMMKPRAEPALSDDALAVNVCPGCGAADCTPSTCPAGG